MSSIEAVLFDLDGTLLDSAPDLCFALNEILAVHNLPAVEDKYLRPYVSLGSIPLLQRGFGYPIDDPVYKELRLEFLAIYAKNLTRASRPFDGVEALLKTLETRGIPWGIVTNKPGFLATPLLAQLPFAQTAACQVSGDTLEHAKPHPAPMYHACEIIGCDPTKVLYVGDAKRDIDAGNRAGMYTMIASYGYIGGEDKPEDWGADAEIDHPSEVLTWLDNDAKNLTPKIGELPA